MRILVYKFLTWLNSDLAVKKLSLIVNENVTSNTIRADYRDNGDVYINGSIVSGVAGTGLSLLGIAAAVAWPKREVVGVCGSYSRTCGDVRIQTDGQIMFNLPETGGYAFNIAYNAHN